MRERGHIKRPPRVDTRIAIHHPVRQRETGNTRRIRGRQHVGHRRVAVLAVDSDGNRISVVVIDLSRDGCRMETPAMLRIGEKVQIEVPKHGTFAAQIRWALGNEAGAVFLEPVFVD